MRILHISNSVKRSGNGIINVAVDLACLQARAGHDVSLASAGGHYEGLLAREGVKHLSLDQTRNPATLLRAAVTLRRYLRDNRPDVVHAHMMTGIVLTTLLRFGLRMRVVATVHNEFNRSSIAMGLADRVIAVSDEVARSLRRRGIPARKLHVVANGTIGSPRLLPIGSYSPAPIQKPAIVTVAGMSHRKGIGVLIEAFERIARDVPTAHLYIVGEGPERTVFERAADACSARDRIHFEGFQAEPQRYLLASDVFVLASLNDPFPLVISEAREAGCAIVASRVSGIPQALDGGEAGILVAAGDVTELADNLRALLDDPEKLTAWRARSSANTEWLSANRVMRQTLLVYR